MSDRVKYWLPRTALALVALAALGFLGASSGIAPIGASSGHWRITSWFLHYSMHRSVGTHALFLEEPRLTEPWLVMKGAGHFETGCRPCHGAPDLPPPVIPLAMTPPAPSLSKSAADWSPKELFYIIKHGIKFTGMPAWPAQKRDDEVRALVAFLRALPKLDAANYRRLVHGDVHQAVASAATAEIVASAPAPRLLAIGCARCHGERGQGRGSAAFPKLAQQKPEYQLRALQAYAQGQRHSGLMQPIAAGLSRRQMAELAEYYAAMPAEAPDPQASGAPAERLGRGRVIVERGIPEQGVPACAECHGPGGGRRNAAYPRLAGQYADYLALQLELFRERRRGGSPYEHLMRQVAARLSPDQIRDVSLYFGSLPPDRI